MIMTIGNIESIESIAENFSETGITVEDVNVVYDVYFSLLKNTLKKALENIRCVEGKEAIVADECVSIYIETIESGKESIYQPFLESFDRTKIIKLSKYVSNGGELGKLGEFLKNIKQRTKDLFKSRNRKFCIVERGDDDKEFVLESNGIEEEEGIKMSEEEFEEFNDMISEYSGSVFKKTEYDLIDKFKDEMNSIDVGFLGRKLCSGCLFIKFFKERNGFSVIEKIFNSLETNKFSKFIFNEIKESPEDKDLLLDCLFDNLSSKEELTLRLSDIIGFEKDDIVDFCFGKLIEKFQRQLNEVGQVYHDLLNLFEKVGSYECVLSELRSKFNSDGE